jgi:hypothetical protein
MGAFCIWRAAQRPLDLALQKRLVALASTSLPRFVYFPLRRTTLLQVLRQHHVKKSL